MKDEHTGQYQFSSLIHLSTLSSLIHLSTSIQELHLQFHLQFTLVTCSNCSYSWPLVNSATLFNQTKGNKWIGVHSTLSTLIIQYNPKKRMLKKRINCVYDILQYTGTGISSQSICVDLFFGLHNYISEKIPAMRRIIAMVSDI